VGLSLQKQNLFMAVKPAAAKAKRICNRNRSLEAWRPGGLEARQGQE